MKPDSRRSSPEPPYAKISLPTIVKESPEPTSAGGLSVALQEMILRQRCSEGNSSSSQARQSDAKDASLSVDEITLASILRESPNGNDSAIADFDEKVSKYEERKARKKLERAERLTTGVRDYGSKVRREMEVQAGRLLPEGFRSNIPLRCSPGTDTSRAYTTAPAKFDQDASSSSSSPGFGKMRTPTRPMAGSPGQSGKGRRHPTVVNQDGCADEEKDSLGNSEPSYEEKIANYWESKSRKPEKRFRDGFRSDDSAVSKCSSLMSARSSQLGAGWIELPAEEVSHRDAKCEQWESPESCIGVRRSWVISLGD
jgi:hypothetical protein